MTVTRLQSGHKTKGTTIKPLGSVITSSWIDERHFVKMSTADPIIMVSYFPLIQFLFPLRRLCFMSLGWFVSRITQKLLDRFSVSLIETDLIKLHKDPNKETDQGMFSHRLYHWGIINIMMSIFCCFDEPILLIFQMYSNAWILI